MKHPVESGDYECWSDYYGQMWQMLVTAYEEERLSYWEVFTIARGYDKEFEDWLWNLLNDLHPTDYFVMWKLAHQIMSLEYTNHEAYERAKAQYESRS